MPRDLFNPETGSLRVTATQLRRLVSGETHAEMAGLGALDSQGRPHPLLWDAIRAMRQPDRGVLRLCYRGRAMDGWRGTDAVALLLPEDDDGHHLLAPLRPHALLPAIARAAGLVQRPRPEPVVQLVTETAASRVCRRRWWLLHGPTWRGPGAALQVIDTEAGLYVVVEDLAVPTDCVSVRYLVDCLLGGRAVRPPLAYLAHDVELPRPAPARARV